MEAPNAAEDGNLRSAGTPRIVDEQRDIERMKRDSEGVEERIDEAREDWERKKADPSVPGADGEADDGGTGPGDAPEADYPTKD